MSASTVVLLSIFFILCLYLFAKVKKIYAYFEERGIPYVPATFPFGSDIKGATFMSHATETFDRMYKKLKKHKVVGFFQFFRPVYLVTDPDFVHRVFVNDFSSFYSKGIGVDEKTNPLDANLFFLSGQKWRFLRQKLCPIFTTGKLRWMYEEMQRCGDTFLKNFERHEGKEIVIKDDLGCLTTDIIGSTFFGIEIDSLINPNSEFRVVGKKVFELTLWESFKFFGRFYFPEILLKCKVRTSPDIVVDFYTSMMKQILESRVKTGVVRKDIVQLLLDLKQNGSVSLDVQDREELMKQEGEQISSNLEMEITDETLTAQSFVFFVAGFETTATTLYFTLYLLSKYPNYQDKAREEVRQVKAKFGNQINFDSLKGLTFLEKCISEALRLFCPVPFISRECTQEYVFPNGTKIEKGSFVILPIHSIHHDPDNFMDPETYNPERFNQPPKPGTYFPFGDGPRICIGKRFAFVEMKMTLARILDRYALEKSEQTKEPITFIPHKFICAPKNNLYIKVRKL